MRTLDQDVFAFNGKIGKIKKMDIDAEIGKARILKFNWIKMAGIFLALRLDRKYLR
jgi:hypothetical protein